jgi:lysophospholipid acyltransferase (LPLAT)-like uncharacterized protein
MMFERAKISLVSSLGYWVIRIVCGTLRWEVRDQRNLESVHASGKRVIFAFWHGRIFPGTYYFRNRGIVVMTSNNRDGEYIARVIQRFGYGAARGSSTRGSHGATVELLRALKAKMDVAFTVDGPTGPRYVAKPGAAYVAWKSGNPVLPFNVSVEKKWVMRSWDHFVVPKPFSRALVLVGDPIYIDPDADEDGIREAEIRLQHSLEELRDRSDSWWGGEPDR